MLLRIMVILFCFNSWFGNDTRHYSIMNCVRSWLRKLLFLSNFVYGYQGRMTISEAIVFDSFAGMITTLIHTFVCKGFEKYVLSFLNRGMIVTWVYVLRDGFIHIFFSFLIEVAFTHIKFIYISKKNIYRLNYPYSSFYWRHIKFIYISKKDIYRLNYPYSFFYWRDSYT